MRVLYDLLMNNAGKPVDLVYTRSDGRRMQALSDFYGLDIRIAQYASKFRGRKLLHILAGEWFGKVYVDYLATTEQEVELLKEARIALTNVDHAENILPAGVHRLSKDSMEILQRVAEKGRAIAAKHQKVHAHG